jgi:UDP-glucose 4-epimerase
MILVTGGLGYIGSHIVVELLQNNNKVIIIDNLANSKIETIDKIKNIVGDNLINLKVEIIDMNNDYKLNNIFMNNKIQKVIHCAGLKSVNESIKNPIEYYETNLNLLINLLKIMEKNNCFHLIFSSSATVYGSLSSPLYEHYTIGIGISNPYGQTKFFQEQILRDLVISDNKWSIVSLRYFNPIGAHDSGLLGEEPNNIPNNLMPYLLKVCIWNYIDKSIGYYPYLNVFGDDYDTNDGTAERDYIHIMDLATAHRMAIESNKMGYNVYNIGTGKSTSVFEIIKTFEKVNNIKIPYKISEKRFGDFSTVFCNNEKAKNELKFETKFAIENMVKDNWNYVLQNYNI